VKASLSFRQIISSRLYIRLEELVHSLAGHLNTGE